MQRLGGKTRSALCSCVLCLCSSFAFEVVEIRSWAVREEGIIYLLEQLCLYTSVRFALKLIIQPGHGVGTKFKTRPWCWDDGDDDYGHSCCCCIPLNFISQVFSQSLGSVLELQAHVWFWVKSIQLLMCALFFLLYLLTWVLKLRFLCQGSWASFALQLGVWILQSFCCFCFSWFCSRLMWSRFAKVWNSHSHYTPGALEPTNPVASLRF